MFAERGWQAGQVGMQEEAGWLSGWLAGSPEAFGRYFMVNLLLRVLPVDHEAEIQLRHMMGQKMIFDTLRQQADTLARHYVHRAAAIALLTTTKHWMNAKGRDRGTFGPKSTAKPKPSSDASATTA